MAIVGKLVKPPQVIRERVACGAQCPTEIRDKSNRIKAMILIWLSLWLCDLAYCHLNI